MDKEVVPASTRTRLQKHVEPIDMETTRTLVPLTETIKIKNFPELPYVYSTTRVHV